MVNPYKTHWYDRKVSNWLNKSPERVPGMQTVPECIHLVPEEGSVLSDKPPVRIFLGTEPGQYRATRVFVWSVMKVRDPGRAYEIHLMCDLAGIDRTDWKTGFTNYRYMIPYLAGNAGHAIYNDVDQIYLNDPALLFDREMNGKGVLAITEKENSVMLVDCDIMASLWTFDDVKAGKKHAHFKAVVSDNDLFGSMPGIWNSRDGEHPVEETGCLHYTTLHTQPWRPFPDQLNYKPNAFGKVWHDLEAEADTADFLLFTRDKPSDESRQLITLYEQMHAGQDEAAHANPDVPKPFAGWSLIKHTETISQLITKTGAKNLLDYGAGKAGSYQLPEDGDPKGAMRVHPAWSGVTIRCYDPGHLPFSKLDAEPCDGVISTDVVEHLAPFDAAWVLDEMFVRARSFVYVVAACYPAKKVLPGGRNAHSIVESPHWWHQQMALMGRRYPDIYWLLACEVRGVMGKKQRKLFDSTSVSPLS